MKLKWMGISLLVFSLGFVSQGMKANAAAPNGKAAAMAAQDHDWDQPPQEFRDVQRRGFHEGIEAARHDVERHRHADADDHETFRHPPVPREDRDAYRDAFRRGYERAMQHMSGDNGGPRY